MKLKFTHTNLVASDWKKLARFYIDVFGCEPVYPERDIKGDWIDRVTNIKDVHIEGQHMRLPGYADGPTLEIFQYNSQNKSGGLSEINKPGFAHIAFSVEDVHLLYQKLLDNGGGKLGELVEKEIAGLGTLTVVYARDPEGNIIEIQNWRQG